MLQLLRTKTSIPPIRPRRIERPHLMKRVEGGIQRALTLVVAPAGFGKTTLLAAWAEAASIPTAWLSLDSGDRAPERFLNYLIRAVQQISPQAGVTAAALLRGGKSISEEGVLYSLLNDFSEILGEFALVLDDYHAAEGPRIAEITRTLLENRPANFHLLIASRTTPDLNLARLRALDQVTEITAADLRFNPEEMLTFLEGVMEVKLSQEELQRLDQSTEGWAVGLQLAAIALSRKPGDWEIPAGQAHVFDYLAEEVLRREPPQVQAFLTRTALFDRFCAPLCDALFGGSLPVADLLASIERSNLFLIPLDASGTWFRYHALFTDFLRQRMAERHPDQVPRLYRVASLWSEENGVYEDAIHYAVHGEDFDRAANLIESAYQEMLQRGEQGAMLEWLSELPSEMLRERPRLVLAQGWASIIAVDADQAMRCADSAAALVPSGEDWDQLRAEASALRILAGIFLGKVVDVDELTDSFVQLSEQDVFLHSLLHFNLGLNCVLTGETRQAVEAFNETIQLTGRLDNPLVAVIALTQLGETHQIRGEPVLAERAFQQAIRFARETLGEHTVLQGMPYVSYAELLREQNRFEEALRYGEQGIAYCRLWLPMAGMDGYLALARLETGRRNWLAAEDYFKQALRTAEGTSTFLDDTFVHIFRARADLLRGDLARAAQWMQTISAGETGARFYTFREMIQLVRLRAQLLRGVSIFEELSGLLPEVERRERVTSQIEALKLHAFALHNAGKHSQAIENLNRALELGARGGYVRIFVDEGEALLELLERYQGELDAPVAYLEGLLEVMRGEARDGLGSPPAVQDLESLTRRELDVLRLLADGKSNQQIADELVLALNTVKKHVANILGKLGVANRTQAVLEAKKSGRLE